MTKTAKSAMVIIAIFIGGIVFFTWTGRGAVSAKHPSLAQLSSLPVIPIGGFFANRNSVWDYRPSPKGKYITWRDVPWGNDRLHIKNQSTGTSSSIILGGAQFFWANDDSKFYLLRWEPERNRAVLWKINPDDISQKWQDVTPRGFANWRLILFPRLAGTKWLLAANLRNAAFVDVYKVNPDGSGKELFLENPGDVTDWRFNTNTGEPVLRIRATGSGNSLLEKRDDMSSDVNASESWKSLLRFTNDDEFVIVTFPKNGKFYATSRRGRDKNALVSIDMSSGHETVVHSHPDVDVLHTFNLRDDKTVDLVEYAPGYRNYIALTDTGRNFLKLLKIGSSPTQIGLSGISHFGTLISVHLSQDGKPWEYFLLDMKTETVKNFGGSAFLQYSDLISQTKPVKIPTTDGLSLPALMTLPNIKSPRKLPTIIMLHGGPAQRDVVSQNYEIQFLANRGYAVLSVNYRGSKGFGRAFQEAGYREFGRKMQDDVIAAVDWAVNTGISDPKAIAVMGGSFGGYMATMALARDPTRFAAGISIVGSTDIAYQTKNAPASWRLGIEKWERYFGSAKVKADLKTMEEFSPVNLVKNITSPILLAHGINDRVVDRAQSERFEAELKRHNKPYIAMYFEREGHGLRRWQTKIKFYTVLENFLAKHLGGRTGGYHYTQTAAKTAVLN